MLNLILFGPPGSGKGTQSARLIAKYGLTHLSTGDLLRAERKAGTPLGRDAQAYIDKGQLVPDAVVVGMIEGKIKELGSSTQGFVFDGFPRNTAQAVALDDMLRKNHLAITAVVRMEVPEAELIARLLKRAAEEGRTDDTPAIIQARLDVYKNETLPVAQHYAAQDKLYTISGVGSMDEILARIDAEVAKARQKA